MTTTRGIVDRPSGRSVDETVARLEALLRSKGITLFALIDHSGEAAKVGLKMPPTKLLIFGKPAAGTALMVAAPRSAIDLPLKILVWEDAQGQVWVSANSAAYLHERHGLPLEYLPTLAAVEALLAAATRRNHEPRIAGQGGGRDRGQQRDRSRHHEDVRGGGCPGRGGRADGRRPGRPARRHVAPAGPGSPDGPAQLVAAALEEHGRLDVLVNNVGAVRLRLGGFLGTSDEEFEWSMKMNFFAAVRATRAALGPMLKAGGGAIVNVASVNAFFEPDAGVLDYGAAKAALVNFTKSIAMEFGPRGVRVNAVSPGPVSTDLWLGKGGVADTVAQATGTDAQQAREKIVAGMGGFATGRFSTPEDVATLVVLLASERTKNVTGSNYVIDGGLIKTT